MKSNRREPESEVDIESELMQSQGSVYQVPTFEALNMQEFKMAPRFEDHHRQSSNGMRRSSVRTRRVPAAGVESALKKEVDEGLTSNRPPSKSGAFRHF